MAKVTGPLMSTTATGSIAGGLTYAGQNTRQHVRATIARQPHTSLAHGPWALYQSFLIACWRSYPSFITASWATVARPPGRTAYQQFRSSAASAWAAGRGPSWQPNATPIPATPDPIILESDHRLEYIDIHPGNYLDQGFWAYLLFARHEASASMDLAYLDRWSFALEGSMRLCPTQPGVTWYAIVALNGTGSFSALSNQIGVTIPQPT
jgi:hypothetical protein